MFSEGTMMEGCAVRFYARIRHQCFPPFAHSLLGVLFFFAVVSTGYSVMPVKQPVSVAGVGSSNSVPYSVSANVLQGRMASSAKHPGVKVAWDRQRAIPALVQGANLLPDDQPLAQQAKGGAPVKLDLSQKAVRVMEVLAGLYGIQNAPKEFSSRSTEGSRSGYQHVRLDQTFKGLPVFGGQVIVHFDGKGTARAVNGHYRSIGDINTTPVLTAAQAAEVAMADQKAMGKNSGAVLEGPKLVVYAYDAEPVLAYQLMVSFRSGTEVGRWRYWVNAVTGDILLRYNDVPTIARPISGAAATITGKLLTQEGGASVSVNGWRENTGAYFMWSFTNTWNLFNAATGDYVYQYTNSWGTSDRTAISAGCNVEATARYFRQIHSRNSIDNAGMMAVARVHNTGMENAFWDGAQLVLFDELPCAVDVVGHEFTHGVTQYSANLIYAKESGALNESMSDIFGTLIEFYLQPDGRSVYPGSIPGHADWLMGEDTAPQVGVFRDMCNPHTQGQPSRYKGTSWDSDQEVHQNSGVQNFFFYLLCEGGDGSNDGFLYGVPGIGRLAAEKVAYLALTGYMVPSTDYSAARDAWLAAANELDTAGITTNAANSVNKAWMAVGLGMNSFDVIEGSTTNVELSNFIATSATGTVISISQVSGSTNLYLIDTSITITNSPVTQSFAVGALNDSDSTNDMAVFRLTSSAGGSVDFQVQQLDTGDRIPPHCVITPSISADRAEVWFDFLFDEPIVGFDSADLVFTSNISGLSLISDPSDLTGSNLLYRARFSCPSHTGNIHLTVPAGSLTDQSTNLNFNLEYDSSYTLPWLKNDFSDDFEQGSTWSHSTNVFAGLTEDGWRFGSPVWGLSWEGPAAAHSGSNCWGTMAGPYSLSLNGWVMSPPFAVGANPILSFNIWMGNSFGFGDGVGYVEVKGTSGWQRLGTYKTTYSHWQLKQISLDNAVYGNRVIQVRFRAVDCAMYIDDVSVDSQRDPAVWIVSSSPTNAPAGTNTPVSFVVYNSTTTTLANVRGTVSSPDAGVTIVDGSPVSYGSLDAGMVVTGAVPVTLQLAAAGNFSVPTIQLFHHFTASGSLSSLDNQPFTIDGVSASSATNLIVVKSSTGVTNWLGQSLSGNGSDASCLFQVIYAGTNGVADVPSDSGQVTGDDRILYSYSSSQAYGRFGEGVVAVDWGEFNKVFTHNLASNAWVYVRAWDAATFDGAAAYGNSALYAIKPLATQTNDFGSWRVGTPAPGSFFRDSNHDSIPDGWCVLSGLDPRQAVAPLHTGVTSATAATDFSYPNRLAVSSNFVFVADTLNSRVQVWNRALTSRLYVLGSSSDTTIFNNPRGIAVSPDGARLAVADTANRRVRVFSVNPTNGVLTSQLIFGSYGSDPNQFHDPMAVAFDAAGQIYVADSQQAGLCNNRVQIFSSNGVFQQTFGSAGSGDRQFGYLLGIGMAANGTLYAADGTNNRVQVFTGGTTYAGQFGTFGTAPGQFYRVWDAQPGVGGLLYVTDFYNNRIQVLNATNPAAITVVGVYSNAGSLGAFNLPQCAVPAPDENVLYVADTYNSRVLRLKTTLDSDGDGMDDVWEILHGLNPNDPSDAFADPDGDGVLNIGESRAGSDPQKRDTDGDGAGDGWEMANGVNPFVSNAVPASLATLTLSASPASPVRPGQHVFITATFSQTITNTPTLTLSGATAFGPVDMTGSGTSRTYEYVIPNSLSGTVNAAVSGAIAMNGYLTDPPTLTSNALFTIFGMDLRISALGMPAARMEWSSLSGDIYRVQYCTNLILTNWTDGVVVTSGVSGTYGMTNLFPTGAPVQFMRVLRVLP